MRELRALWSVQGQLLLSSWCKDPREEKEEAGQGAPLKDRGASQHSPHSAHASPPPASGLGIGHPLAVQASSRSDCQINRSHVPLWALLGVLRRAGCLETC